MNRKVLRFTFRNGDIRFGELPASKTLQDMWHIFKIDGAVIGGGWCAQFDHVAMIEVVEMAGEGPRMESPPGPTFGPIDRFAVVTSGGFKPPGDA